MDAGFDLDFVVALDLISFRNLLDSMDRVEKRKTVEEAWVVFAASQCEASTLQKVLNSMFLDDTQTDVAKFLQDFGKGI